MGVRAWAGNGIIVTLQIQWDGKGVAANWTLYLEFAKSLRTNSCEIVISYSGHNWLSVILWIKFCWQSTVLTRRIEEVSDKLLWTVDCILSVFLTPIIRKWWVTTSAEEQFLETPNSHHTSHQPESSLLFHSADHKSMLRLRNCFSHLYSQHQGSIVFNTTTLPAPPFRP